MPRNQTLPSLRGRSAATNPPNRFERLHMQPDPEQWPAGRQTVLLRDTTRRIITRNQSPDVGFDFGINPYRGCEHACAYCYARPGHEFLGMSAGLDFESRILVKHEAPELLRRELSSPRWKPTTIVMSGVTDPYQPAERKLEITRRCLQVFAETRHPVGMITKSHLIIRDADLLGDLASIGAAGAAISITTLDHRLQRKLEPRASSPARRLKAIQVLAEAGVPVRVNVAPIIPGLTDHEIPAILNAAAAAGAVAAGWIMLRLPYGVAELFADWLERHAPDRKEKVLSRVRDMRGGRLNDARWSTRMSGEGVFAGQVRQLLEVSRKRAGLLRDLPPLRTDAFRRPPRPSRRQLELFDG